MKDIPLGSIGNKNWEVKQWMVKKPGRESIGDAIAFWCCCDDDNISGRAQDSGAILPNDKSSLWSHDSLINLIPFLVDVQKIIKTITYGKVWTIWNPFGGITKEEAS